MGKMTDTEFKKKWLPLLNKISFKESFEADIEDLKIQSFNDGFNTGWLEAMQEVIEKLGVINNAKIS